MTTNTRREELQKKIASARKETNRKRRYSAALKREIVAYARTRLKKGVSLALLAEDLGLNPSTLQSWLQRDADERQPTDVGNE